MKKVKFIMQVVFWIIVRVISTILGVLVIVGLYMLVIATLLHNFKMDFLLPVRELIESIKNENGIPLQYRISMYIYVGIVCISFIIVIVQQIVNAINRRKNKGGKTIFHDLD